MTSAPNSTSRTTPQGSARRFWQRVSDGLEMSELWTQFTTEARSGYSLYSKEVDWEGVRQAPAWKRPLKVSSAIFWAMFMKLTPARRVLLLLALVLVLKAVLDVHIFFYSGPRWTHTLWATLILLTVLALELADRLTMKRDLEIARDIQRWLVPDKPPAVPGFDIAFATRPANTVAGDYYDAFYRTTPQGERLLIVVADVAGKSVPAALLMATFQASLQALATGLVSLAELVAALNRYTCTRSLGGLRFTTAFLAELDPATRALTYICAGHNPPILRRVAGDTSELSVGGVPLGIDAGAHFEQASVSLVAGDLLLIYTDGLIEAVNDRGEEFGLARVTEILHAVPGETAEQTLQHLLEAVNRFVGRAPQHDDITCLLLRAIQ